MKYEDETILFQLKSTRKDDWDPEIPYYSPRKLLPISTRKQTRHWSLEKPHKCVGRRKVKAVEIELSKPTACAVMSGPGGRARCAVWTNTLGKSASTGLTQYRFKGYTWRNVSRDTNTNSRLREPSTGRMREGCRAEGFNERMSWGGVSYPILEYQSGFGSLLTPYGWRWKLVKASRWATVAVWLFPSVDAVGGRAKHWVLRVLIP